MAVEDFVEALAIEVRQRNEICVAADDPFAQELLEDIADGLHAFLSASSLRVS